MNSITIVRTPGLMFASFVLAAFAVLAPTAHAADLGLGSVDFYPDQYASYYPDTTSYDQGTSFYPDQYTNFYPDQYSTFYPDQYSYTTPSSYYGGGCSSCGGGFSGGGFSYPGFGFGGTSGGSTFAPTTVSNNVPTTIYSPSNTNICTGGNTCNSTVDDHSIFNAPTTVTVTNPAPAQTQVVYQQVPVYQQPNYPVYNNPCYTCQQPIVYPTPVRQPYVSLNQVPYTGLDLGPVGTVVYWGFLTLWCLVAAYLIVYKRVQTKMVAGLNRFLFGAPAAVGTHAKVVMPAKAETHKAYVAPAAHNDDAIDPFIASQIARNK